VKLNHDKSALVQLTDYNVCLQRCMLDECKKIDDNVVGLQTNSTDQERLDIVAYHARCAPIHTAFSKQVQNQAKQTRPRNGASVENICVSELAVPVKVGAILIRV
jgi:hypothetical protein